MEPEIVLLRAAGLLLGVPAFLLGVFWLLDRLESWVVKPDERAAEVQALLAQVERAEEVEDAVARLLAPVDSELTPSGGLLARARARARARAARRGHATDLSPSDRAVRDRPPSQERARQPVDGPRSLRRQEALADAQEALLEASSGASGDDEADRSAPADAPRPRGR